MTVAIGKLERQSIMSHVTLRDIPKEATVPTTTISRALNSKPNVSPKTKDKILRIAKNLGHTPEFISFYE